ncbi:MAG TPA: hypothetical protein VFO41_16570 [Alphaproteobacteria bacterium]|nr:hypothetical protein [Alphaproteobacteria bacterium]
MMDENEDDPLRVRLRQCLGEIANEPLPAEWLDLIDKLDKITTPGDPLSR